jgi:hypothetical protein
MMLWCSRGCRIFLVCFGICFLSLFAPFVLSAQALAASDPITIASQTDTITFPKGIDFQLNADDSSSPIVQATIVFKIEGDNQQQQTLTVNPPTRAVTLHWHKDTTGDQFEPVGTSITYYWVLRDQASNVHMGTLQMLSQVDTRFNWQRLSQGNLQVNWYNRPQDFGQAVLQEASKDLAAISANLGGGLQHPINLWIYQNTNDFHSSLPPATHEWVGGIAFPSLSQASLVVESMDSDTLNRDMPHEMTHLVFHQLTARGIYAPIWFDEGLAVYNQLYHEPMMTLSLKQALKAHALLRLNDLTFEFPADANKAYLAYAQSWNLVNYMYTTFGQKKMAVLILAMNNPKTSFNQDLVQAFHIDQAHLENQWHLYLNQPPTLTADQTKPASLPVQQLQALLQPDPNAPFLLALGILLIMLPALGIGGLVIYQRRSRAKVALARQTQRIIHTTISPYDSPMRTVHTVHTPPYTGPNPYRPSYPPPSYRPVDTPAGSERTSPGDKWQPPFPAGQRNIRRQPDRSVSQE